MNINLQNFKFKLIMLTCVLLNHHLQIFVDLKYQNLLEKDKNTMMNYYRNFPYSKN